MNLYTSTEEIYELGKCWAEHGKDRESQTVRFDFDPDLQSAFYKGFDSINQTKDNE